MKKTCGISELFTNRQSEEVFLYAVSGMSESRRILFLRVSSGWYCRRCVSFGRMMLEEEREAVPLKQAGEGSEEYTLQYPLTKAQAQIG